MPMGVKQGKQMRKRQHYLPDRNCRGRERMALCGKSCWPTCTLMTTYRGNNRTFDSQPGVQGL